MGLSGIVLGVFICQLICFQTWAFFCSPETFGSLCQYKCRCTNNQCGIDGNCIGTSKCLPGWFGPACQYYNLARLSRRSYLSPVITDDDDTTCNHYEDLVSMRGSWSATYHFSWLRLIVDQQASDVFDNITVIIKNNGTETTCADLTRVDVDNRTQDIHCPASVLMSEIQLMGPGVKSLCSLYISGGRNVAIMQNTSQSSTFQYMELLRHVSMNSGKAVNGNPISESDNSSCSSTEYEYKPHWYLTLSESKLVTRYTVYSTDFYTYKLHGFILESYDDNQQLLLQYRDSGAVKSSYTIIDPKTDQHVRRVVIYAVSHATLTLCEVELYGDSDCARGHYGRDCEHTCNCDVKSDSCFVSTGGCPSGCTAGFYGEGCRKACDYGTFGKGCTQKCSDQCAKVACAATDGTCIDGCREGYKPPLCFDECGSGFYGRNCAQPCSKNCNGTCEKQKGSCLHGCTPGYEGVFCDNALPLQPTAAPRDTTLAIAASVVPIIAAAILVVAAVIGVFISRRRHKRADDGHLMPGHVQGEAETIDIRTIGESVGWSLKANTEVIDKDKPAADNAFDMVYTAPMNTAGQPKS
ncbi:hypothetical protein BsWGS_02214 [Bradybaena similaris]